MAIYVRKKNKLTKKEIPCKEGKVDDIGSLVGYLFIPIPRS
jgi:hypothetical protein